MKCFVDNCNNDGVNTLKLETGFSISLCEEHFKLPQDKRDKLVINLRKDPEFKEITRMIL